MTSILNPKYSTDRILSNTKSIKNWVKKLERNLRRRTPSIPITQSSIECINVMVTEVDSNTRSLINTLRSNGHFH